MGQTEKKPVTREDLFQFQFVSEVSFSPDGQWASYVVNQADREENRYHSGIWAVNMGTKENKLLAARGEAKAPVWLDGVTLLFALHTLTFAVAPDNTHGVWCGPEYDSVMPRTCGLYLYNIEEGKQKQLVKEDLYDVNQVCFMGDGQFFYTASTYERVGKHPR